MVDDDRFKVNTGHRGPRKSKGRPRVEGGKDTVSVINRIRDQLLLIGPTRDVDIRRHVAGIDRQRIRPIRQLLVRDGMIYLTGQKPIVWNATDRLPEVDAAQLMGNVTLTLMDSAIAPGCVQVFCSFCGLQKRPWRDRRAARAWFWNTHIKKSVGHVLS